MKRTGKLIVLLSSLVCLAAIFFAVSMNSNAAVPISKATVSTISPRAYTGKAVTPAVTVKYGSKTLTKGTHYTVSYKNNVNVGIATLTITGRGSYSGSKTVRFYIVSPAVTGLSYKNVTQTSVYLYWKASPKATGYQIYKFDTVTKAYKYFRVSAKNAVAINGLAAGSTTVFRVRPYSRLANGKFVYGSLSPAIKVLTRPADVAGVAQSAAKANAATVSWKAAAGATGYQVYLYDAAAKKYVLKAAVKTNRATLTGLAPALTSVVRVRAYRTINGSNLVSALSPAIQLKTLPKADATGLFAYRVYDKSVTLKWDAVQGAELYRIYQLKSGKWTSIGFSKTNSRTVSSLAPCTDYSFRVVTCVKSANKYFIGAAKSTLKLITRPETVTGVTASEITENSITLSWNGVPAKTGYQIYKLDPLTGKNVYVTRTNTTSCTVGGLSEVSEYTFRVRAYYKASSGSYVYGVLSPAFTAKTHGPIEVTSPVAYLWVGSTVQCTVIVNPDAADKDSITWSSSNEACATVTQTGLVTGKSLGKVNIYATDANGIKGYCVLTVSERVAEIKPESAALALSAGDTAVLKYQLLPADAYSTGVTFSSSKPSVATVNANGVVTAVGGGTAVITVASKDNAAIKAECTITVTMGVSGVSLNAASASMYTGESKTLTATVAPSDATNKNVTWSSSNTAVATVSSKGVVKAIKSGTAVITVTTVSGAKTATCKITVKAHVSGVSVSPEEAVLYVGDTKALTAAVTPADADNKAVTWKSSNTSVATVDAKGVVKAIKNGTAVITVTTSDSSKTDTCKITVKTRVGGLTVSPSSLVMYKGESKNLSATVTPADASDKTLLWSSSDAAVASVSGSGVVLALKNGTAVITVSTADKSKTDTCSVTVKTHVGKISLDSSEFDLYKGETKTLTATVTPADASDKSVSFTSSNTAVATVNGAGVVKAVANGTATITAATTDGNKTASCKVTVKTRVSSVALSASSATVYLGETQTLTATVSPSDATNKAVSFKSSNTSVATVNASGKVTAKAVGTATITVTTADGAKTAECAVTVEKRIIAVSSVTLSASTATVKVDETKTLTATVLPTDATNKEVTWSSSNPSVAKVYTNGRVTGVKSGTAVITVSTVDGAKTASCTVTVPEAAPVLPDVSTASSLLTVFTQRLNKIKMYDLPAFTSVNNVSFSNVKLKTPTLLVNEGTFVSLFDDLIENETTSLPAVADSGDYSTALAKYTSEIPVRGYSKNVLSGVDPNAIDMAKSGIKDNSTSYTLTVTLKPETYDTLPERTANKNHGKMFDILYKSYMDTCIQQLEDSDIGGVKISMGYSSFKTTYSNCSVAITVDKSNNKVVKAVYDMNLLVEIGKLEMKAGVIPFISSDASFNVNSNTNITFTY